MRKRLERLTNGIELYNKKVSKELTLSIDKIAKKQIEEEKLLIELLNKKQALEKKISQIQQPYKNVLYLRYIKALRYEEIAKKMNYSVKRIYQLHNEALKLYADLSNN